MVRKYDAIFCRFFCKFVRINFQIFYFNTKATLDHLVDFHYVSFWFGLFFDNDYGYFSRMKRFWV